MTIKSDIGLSQDASQESQTVRQSIEHLFAESAYHELRLIQVDVDDEHIGLTGTVPSFFMKQVAQETVRQVCGMRKICNRIDVI